MKKYHIPTIIFENEIFSTAVKMELNAAFFLYFNDELHFNVLDSLLKIRGASVSSESLKQTTFRVVNILPLLPKMEANKLECLFLYSYLCYLGFKYRTTSIAIDIQCLTNLLNLKKEIVLFLIDTLVGCDLICKELKDHHYIVNFAPPLSK